MGTDQLTDIDQRLLELVRGAQIAVVELDDGLVQQHFGIVGSRFHDALQVLQTTLVILPLVLGQRLLGPVAFLIGYVGRGRFTAVRFRLFVGHPVDRRQTRQVTYNTRLTKISVAGYFPTTIQYHLQVNSDRTAVLVARDLIINHPSAICRWKLRTAYNMPSLHSIQRRSRIKNLCRHRLTVLTALYTAIIYSKIITTVTEVNQPVKRSKRRHS